MSISAVGSASYSTYPPYALTNATQATSSLAKPSSPDNPLAKAIANLKTSDPELAAKLQTVSDKAAELRKSGASEKDVFSAVHSALDSLSPDQKKELGAARGARPAGGARRGGHHHGGPKPAETSSSTSAATANPATGSTFSASALLDAAPSSNSAIAALLGTRAGASDA